MMFFFLFSPLRIYSCVYSVLWSATTGFAIVYYGYACAICGLWCETAQAKNKKIFLPKNWIIPKQILAYIDIVIRTHSVQLWSIAASEWQRTGSCIIDIFATKQTCAICEMICVRAWVRSMPDSSMDGHTAKNIRCIGCAVEANPCEDNATDARGLGTTHTPRQINTTLRFVFSFIKDYLLHYRRPPNTPDS